MTTRKLSIIKFNSIKLRGDFQIPLFLCKCINDLTDSSPVDYVSYLISLTECYMRVKGFYKKYPKFDNLYSRKIKKDLEERGFIL